VEDVVARTSRPLSVLGTTRLHTSPQPGSRKSTLDDQGAGNLYRRLGEAVKSSRVSKAVVRLEGSNGKCLGHVETDSMGAPFERGAENRGSGRRGDVYEVDGCSDLRSCASSTDARFRAAGSSRYVGREPLHGTQRLGRLGNGDVWSITSYEDFGGEESCGSSTRGG